MRGFPLLQLLLTLAVFAAAGWPVWRLTRPPVAQAAAAPVAEESSSAPVATAVVEASFAPAPTEFKVSCLGQSVLTGQGPQAQFAAPWTARLLFVLVLMVIPGSQILVYPILWILMPSEETVAFRSPQAPTTSPV